MSYAMCPTLSPALSRPWTGEGGFLVIFACAKGHSCLTYFQRITITPIHGGVQLPEQCKITAPSPLDTP